ncbi:hypothetical protein ACIPK7_15895 [Pseudomonas sp. NPDC086581]|uniref:hypothetical protein n=1 Tax=Pseudomonas sp. NPDC086581 TaxID=3364432 RepID=UPI00382C60F1
MRWSNYNNGQWLGVAVLTVLVAMLFSFSASAAEILKGESGVLILKGGSSSSVYRDVLGSKDGVYRDLIFLNSAPALLASGREDVIYTLKVEGGKAVIDCVIAEARSNQTGISIRKSMCGVNKELWSNYSELGYSYTDQWKGQAASVDVSSLVVRGNPLDIVDGVVEGIEIHQVYKAISQLEDAAPQIYLKKGGKCFEFPNGKVFIDYSVARPKDPVGVMVLDDVSGYDFKRYMGGDLNKLNFKFCKL